MLITNLRMLTMVITANIMIDFFDICTLNIVSLCKYAEIPDI